MPNIHPAILPLRGEELKALPRLPCSQESGCDKSPPSHPVQSEKAESRGESEERFVLLLVFLLVVVAWFRSCQETFQCHWWLLHLKRGRNPLGSLLLHCSSNPSPQFFPPAFSVILLLFSSICYLVVTLFLLKPARMDSVLHNGVNRVPYPLCGGF